MNVKAVRYVGYSAAIGTLLITAACLENPRQRASEIFSDGKIPALAEGIINPKPPAPTPTPAGKIALDIAVVDNGVDYLHPHLKSRIKFDVQDGRTTGAGYDLWAKDNWAYPVLFEPSLFAFGAELDAEGKIAKHVSDPMAELTRLNGEFMTMLMKKIGRAGGLIARKLDKNSFHVLGAKILIMNKEVYLRENNTGVYDLFRLRGVLIPSENSGKKITVTKTGVLKAGALTMLFDMPWTLGPVDGLPVMPSVPIAQLEHFDDFINLVEKIYADFDKQHSFEERFLKPYIQYRMSEESNPSGNSKNGFELSYIKELYKKWFRVGTNYLWEDPWTQIMYNICTMLEPNYVHRLNGSKKPEEQLDIVLKAINDAAKNAETIAGFQVKSSARTSQDKNSASEAIEFFEGNAEEKRESFRQFVLQQVKERGPGALTCDVRTLTNQALSPQLSAFYNQTKTPYITDSSDVISHGSHVSGIVASQHPDLNIVPLRIFLETIATDETQNKKMKSEFFDSFFKWMKQDGIAPAIARLYLESKGQTVASLSQAEAVVVIEGLLRAGESKGMFDMLFEQNKADIYFTPQLVDAVRYVGTKKIKIVNMSIGSDFSIPFTPFYEDKTKNFLNFLKFLAFEFDKYQIGDAIRKYAQHTIFVVAAGNSAHWMDALSRGAIPCDISSQFLQTYGKGVQAPNNEVNNILCVGSLNEKDWLSQFTNVNLADKPFVLTRGEAIESAIRVGDLSGVRLALNKKFGSNPQFLATNETEMEAFIRTQPKGDRIDKEEMTKRVQAETSHYNAATSLLGQLLNFSALQSFVSHPDTYVTAKMSGTSMASPRAAGFIGSYILDKMKKLGISDQAEAWARPEFAPAQLISEILAKAPRFGGTSRINDLPKFADLKEYALRNEFQAQPGNKIPVLLQIFPK